MPLDADKLLTEQIHSAFSSYPSVAIANLLSSILVYVALNALDDVNHAYLAIWLSSQFAISLTWGLLYRRYYNHYTPIRAIWENRIEIPTSIWAGLNWGMVWALYINPANLQSAFFLNAAICGVVTGIVVGNPLNRKVMLATLLPCLLPVIAKALWLGGPLFNWTAMIAAVLLLASIAFNTVLQKLYLNMLHQREENARLAAELLLEKQQVEKISAEKTRFLAAASHDLRQPIQAMRLFEGALAASLSTPEQHSLLEKISAAGKSLSQLLEKLLDISRLDSGSISVEPAVIHLDDLLYHLQQQYSSLASAQGIDLRIAPTSLQAFIDPTQLERILGNLLSNAISHMGRPGKILLGVRRRQGRALVEVWDNGQGIPQHEQEKIFDEFYQVGNKERNRSKGLGLGLPIVRRLCRLNACQLEFHSNPGKGTRFGILIPETGTPPSTSGRIAEPIPLPAETFYGSPKDVMTCHILLLEDDQEVGDALQSLLTRQGLKVTLTHSLQAALDCMQEAAPDIILTDYQLQHNDNGLQAVASLRKQAGWEIPTLILTGNTSPDTVKILSRQPLPVLYKPVEAAVLHAQIRTLLANMPASLTTCRIASPAAPPRPGSSPATS